MISLEKPGLRIIKTSIAVFLSLLICHIRSDQSIPFYGAIAAIICMRTGLLESIDIGLNRILGTIIGGFTGLIYLLSFKKMDFIPIINYLLVSLVIFLLIWLMANLDKPNAISIMCVVFVSITINHGEAPDYPVDFALNRMIDTLVGVIIAIFVNWFDFKLRKRFISKEKRV
ncbi:MAG: aromatic acid exporter family protein [Peptoniphilaceae bacterium]|nr:aromatic acid exporter family protein [Peptoniphilaceae bacterium]MDY6018057.1 aromatic acid exporter family protein [Anaerococcus sp.]